MLAALAAIAGPPATAASKPNVIVIMTDDQGYGDLSAHGNPYVKTPRLDALHRESIRFTDFHVDPTCSPTRAALLTGRYSARAGVWLTYAGRNHLRRDEVTLADVFAHNGYATGIFGKWHLGDNYPFRPNDRGFQESLVHGGGVIGEAPDHWGNDYFDDVYLRNGNPERVSGYCTDVWFDEAMRFIRASQDGPFFVYLPTNAPHGPRHLPAGRLEPFLNRPGIPESRARFYGMMRQIDDNVGRLRTHLSESGLNDNTILVFLTDNGGTGGATLRTTLKPGETGFLVNGFNAGMRGKKGAAYEGGHRAASSCRGQASWRGRPIVDSLRALVGRCFEPPQRTLSGCDRSAPAADGDADLPELVRRCHSLQPAPHSGGDHGLMDPVWFDLATRPLRFPSRSILAKTARLKLAGFDRTLPVRKADRAIRFRVPLKGGQQSLRAWFGTEGGDYGAYYVCIEPAGD